MSDDTTSQGRRATAGPARWIGIGLVLVLAVTAVVLVTGGEAECTTRLPGVRGGVCLPDPADRPDAPDQARGVLGQDTQLSLEEFTGDVVVVNFWASWCGPCRREQPDLNRAAADLEPLGVTLVGVNVQDDSTSNALAHETEFEIPYPSIEDPSAQYAASFRGIGPRTMPSTVFVDRQGRVAVSLFGETDYDEVVTLARLLAEEPA